MKIIFDFDDVVFDTKKFKERIFLVLEKYEIANAREVYESYRREHPQFSLVNFLEDISEMSSNKATANLMYEEIMDGCQEFIQPEVQKLIEQVGAINCYVVSQGDEDFQREKIKRSIGSVPLLGVCVVKDSKKDEIKKVCEMHRGEEVIFVDDKARNFNNIDWEACINLKTVLYNHNGFANLYAEINASLQKEAKMANVAINTLPRGLH